MANFVVNSTSTIAVRKTEVLSYEIQPFAMQIEDEAVSGYQLLVMMARGYDPDVIFEKADTLELLNPLVATFHNAMEL